jgi:hypothetical protein
VVAKNSRAQTVHRKWDDAGLDTASVVMNQRL